MAKSFGDRIKHAFNVFRDIAEEDVEKSDPGFASSSVYSGSRPDRFGVRFSSERSIIASIYNRISVDAAAIKIQHIRVDDNDRFVEQIKSGLNTCLSVEANIDQAGRAFRQDCIQTLCEVGTVAIVPVETDLNPNATGGYDIRQLRVGRIVGWMPRHVRVRLYDDRVGDTKEITVPKSVAAIAENPFYTVMNETNSTLQRLVRKLNYLDVIDSKTSSGKLDLIIQLPYALKGDLKKQAAETRRQDLEAQLQGSTYGIGYVDATEKITQLNRPAENNLLAQVEYLTEQLYSELGLTKEIMDGTATEPTMINYYNRTIDPLLGALSEAMARTFLTKTARTQMQTVTYFRDPFKLVQISSVAEIADKFTRNEILTANEVRGIIGMKPSSDPGADELRNKNIPAPVPETGATENPASSTKLEEESQNGSS